MTVILIGFHRKAVSAHEERVSADADDLGETEELDFLYHGDGRFSLRTLAGKFIRAWPSGKLDAQPVSVRDWEIFRLVKRTGGRFGVLTHHELYMSAQPNGELLADRAQLSDWEEFYLHDSFGADQLFGAASTAGGGRSLGSRTVGELYDFYSAHPDESESALLSLLRSPASTPPARREGR
jgi:hypothetical protein